MKRVLTGIQPTNDLTFGNYFGSINELKNFLHNDELFIFVADLHSITLGNFDHNLLMYKKNIVKYYLASGLIGDNVYIFNQSSLIEHTILNHILLCISTIGELERMTQFKDKSQKQTNGTEKISAGLLTYPVLMASDILLYDTDLVVVGMDQKQHLELTKNLANRFNKKIKKDILKIPQIQVSKVSFKIMDLQNPTIKMSKSNLDKKGVIFLNDDLQVNIKKIKSAKTDSFDKVKYDLKNQPGISNLINIYSCLTNKNIEEIELEFQEKNYAYFKERICEAFTIFHNGFSKKFNSINDEQINDVLKKGLKKAKEVASKKIDEIYNIMGFGNEY